MYKVMYISQNIRILPLSLEYNILSLLKSFKEYQESRLPSTVGCIYAQCFSKSDNLPLSNGATKITLLISPSDCYRNFNTKTCRGLIFWSHSTDLSLHTSSHMLIPSQNYSYIPYII